MKIFKLLLMGLLPMQMFAAHSEAEKKMAIIVDASLKRAREQSIQMAKSLENDSLALPKTFEYGVLKTSKSSWWCSGFFPGVLWYLYENEPSAEMQKYAEMYTKRVEREKYTTNNHDVGFIIYCSFGNGLRLMGTESYKEVILKASKSLITRYNEKLGLIRSWDSKNKGWQYPVIIDNMMNLEMLLWATKYTGDKNFQRIAVNHADRTMAEHFRPDHSCYHLVDYDTITGKARKKQTVQGYSDNSAWARGQGWALYGYSMMYRETGDKRYLKQAEDVAKYLINHPNMPKDGIPYWDFNDPKIPNAPRDASAGAIYASALIQLSGQTSNKAWAKKYIAMAETEIRALSSPEYLAESGSNGNFVLKHSVGHLTINSEVDVPLTYADYYFIEALTRYKNYLKNH